MPASRRGSARRRWRCCSPPAPRLDGRGRHLPQLSPATPAIAGRHLRVAGRSPRAALAIPPSPPPPPLPPARSRSPARRCPSIAASAGTCIQRTSPVDGKTYTIQFEMRLPVAWNGRFFHQGNGGIDGSVVTANTGFGGGAADHAAAAGLRGAVLRRRPQQRAGRPGLRPGSAGASRLRLPGGGQADADGQAGHRGWPTARDRTARTSAAAPTAGGTRWWPPRATRRTTTATSPVRRATTCRWPRWPTSSARSATPPWPPATRSRRRGWRPAFTAAERRVLADAVLARCDRLDGASDGLVQDTAHLPARVRPASVTCPRCAGCARRQLPVDGAEGGDRADLQRRHAEQRAAASTHRSRTTAASPAAASRSGSSPRRCSSTRARWA